MGMPKVLWRRKGVRKCRRRRKNIPATFGFTFTTSETVWYKAIVTDVLTHRPTRRSKVLHVELIDPLNNQIIDKSLLR